MKKDLKDCTFIIPVRIESTDRLRNVITILCYLNSNFDTNIIVKEVDKESVFDKDALPQVEEYCGDVSNIKYIFEKSDPLHSLKLPGSSQIHQNQNCLTT